MNLNACRFLRELLSTFFSIGGKKGKIDFDELGINDVVEMLRDANMDAVLRDFDDRNPQEDPVIHFYEDFLRQYDAHQKIKRGAFYTPRPVVSFIVRSVHEILKKDFGLEYGLADTTTWGEMMARFQDIKECRVSLHNTPFVQILDPAVGTGTFLVEVIDLIYKTMAEKWETQPSILTTSPKTYGIFTSADIRSATNGSTTGKKPNAAYPPKTLPITTTLSKHCQKPFAL